MNPNISIIIPAYQTEDTIRDCLESIFHQTYKDFEVIVVNDGSTDVTAEILESYGSRIAVITQQNKGRNPARNRGLQDAHGKYLLFCDADIILDQTFLEKTLKALTDHPETSIAYSSFYYGRKKFRLWPYDANRLRTMNFIHTTSLVRREHFPGFDEAIQRLQDWDVWLTMLEHGHTGVWVPEYLFRVRTHKGGLSSWLPEFMYRIPWNKLGLHLSRVDSYKTAEAVIKKKHHLDETKPFPNSTNSGTL